VVVITSGGTLGNEAISRSVPYLKIPYQGEPRTALGFSFLSPLGLLQQLGLITDKNQEIIESVKLLEDSMLYYRPECPSNENPAKALSELLFERMAVIYAGGFLGGVARRWKTQINENAKTWAFVETLPELNHNAVAGYQFPQALSKSSFVVLLRSSLLQEEVASLYPMTLAILEKASIDFQVMEAPGTTPLGQILATSFRGDWVSYYLALLNGVDPSPVTAIDEIKSRLDGQIGV
jgi:glucose/mannose-6-phosphate isomerase